MTRVTSKDIARSLPLADLSSLPTSNPGGNKPWRSAGTTGWQIVVGNFTAPGGGVTDHGALTGLADDDHPQYVLANGSRAMTGSLTISGLSNAEVILANAGASFKMRLNEAAGYAYSEFVSTGGLSFRADNQSMVFGYSYFDLQFTGLSTLRSNSTGRLDVNGLAGWDDLLDLNAPSFQSGLILNCKKGGTSVASVSANGKIATVSGVEVGPITKAVLLATTPAANAGIYRITNSTPANRHAYPDGTNWRYLDGGGIVT